MAKYRITAPDGQSYEVNAPEGATEQDAMAYVQKNLYKPKAAEKGPDPSEGGINFRPFGLDTGLEMPQGLSRFLAGAGKGMTDIGRGAAQMVGAIDRQDVDEIKKRDAPLMNTGAGMAGDVVGQIAPAIPFAAAGIPAAIGVGAAQGALTPVGTQDSRLQNMAIGGGLGAAGPVLVRGGNAAYQGAKSLVQPLTRSGQEQIAADVLRASATNPQAAAANLARAREFVPGSSPTVGQAAQDPGLAQLERTLLNNPEYAGPLNSRFAAQKAARSKAVADVAGSDEHYNAIKDGRRIFANDDYSNAMKQGIDGDMAKSLEPQIQNLMERPSMQQAQKTAIRLAKENGQDLSNFGSVEGMDWLKKALDNQISKASMPGSSIGKEDLKALLQTKSDLMSTLEAVSPAYKAANDNFAKMSGQVNSMDVARNLQSQLNRAGSEYSTGGGKEMGDAYMRALSNAKESVKKSTGMNKGISDVMNTPDIAALEGVALDLGRKSYAETAGRAAGSPTAQNMLSQNMLRRVLGPAGLPESWAENSILQAALSPVQMAGKFTGVERKVMDRIAAGLLDPQDAVGLLSASSPQKKQAILSLLGGEIPRRLATPVAPAIGLLPNR
jgi:hypothetical protein